MHCLNCGETIKSNYCPNCGQSANLGRYNLKYISHRFLDSIDIDKGLFYTIKVLLIRPGIAIRDYVDGKRVMFYNPIKLLIISGAIVAILLVLSTEAKETVSGPLRFLNLPDHAGFNTYSRRYFPFFSITAIPFFALFSWLLFYKSGFNYWENLVMNIYVAVGQFLITLLYIPFKSFGLNYISLIYGFINIGYNIWVLVFFFRVRNVKGGFLAVAAVILPQVGAYFYNYIIYRIAPSDLWHYLDLIFSF